MNEEDKLIVNSNITDTFSSISEEQNSVLNAVIQYAIYNIKNDYYDSYDEYISLDIQVGMSGKTDGNASDGYVITIPGTNAGGFIATQDIIGSDADNNTFRQYDYEVAIVHELSHVILQLLSNDDYIASNELDLAVLAAAVQKTTYNPITEPIEFAVELKKILGISKGELEKNSEYGTIYDAASFGWISNDAKIEQANLPNSSYENIYNISREYTAISGLSGVTAELYRNGYGVHPGYLLDEADKHWYSIPAGQGEDYDGHYKNLLFFGENVAMLGNQYGNTIATGTGNDYIDGGNGNDILRGEAGEDTLIGGAGEDRLYGGGGNDTLYGDKSDNTTPTDVNNNDDLYGGSGDDILYGGIGEDNLHGGADNDTLDGGENDDVLLGGSGIDTLVGGAGNDVLMGNDGFGSPDTDADNLLGGEGYDTYIVGNEDVIFDEDGSGIVVFNNQTLSGKKTKVKDTDNLYEDDIFTYAKDGSDLYVVNKQTQEYITIADFVSGALGIVLEEDIVKKDIELYTGDATVNEGGDLEFIVAITEPLKYDLSINLESVFNGSAQENDLSSATSGEVIIKAGELNTSFTISTTEDTQPEDIETFIFAPMSYTYAGEGEDANDLNSLTFMNAGEGTIIDNASDVVVTISDSSSIEGDVNDNNTLTFIIESSKLLEGDESITLKLNIEDITTDWSDYGYLSQDTITLNASNQSQTITLELFGDTEKEDTETLNLTATVQESNALGNIMVKSGTGTIVDDDQGATPYDDILILTDEADTMDALAGNDYVEGKNGDVLLGNEGNDILWSGKGNDVLYGGKGNTIVNNDIDLEREVA